MRRLDTSSYGSLPGKQAPESVRQEFAALIELGQHPDNELIARLWGCLEIMPPHICHELGLPPGTTYARALRFLCWS
jgi:hypothetical protein